MHNGEFQYLKDYESRIEALEKGSKGEVEIWVDMPAHQNDRIRETQGNPVPFRLFCEGVCLLHGGVPNLFTQPSGPNGI